MNTLMVSLENCYGIKRFEHEFHFSECRSNLVYAPNGVMKTSLAKTFSRISEGNEPEEKLFGRAPSYDIRVDGNALQRDSVFVVKPFDSDYESSNLSTLLVNPKKKSQYDSAYKEILKSRKALVVKLGKRSGLKKDDIEQTITNDLGCSTIFDAIEELKIASGGSEKLKNVPYSKIFNSKVLPLLKDPIVKEGIDKYIDRYQELIAQSSLFSSGKFDTINAAAIAKSLKSENYFRANHKLLLNGDSDAVSASDELQTRIESETKSILEDEKLKTIYQKIIDGVAPVKEFQRVLEENPGIAPLLADPDECKKSIWASYYEAERDSFDSLLSIFEEKREELTSIQESARIENTDWYDVQKIFKDRFFVPFDLEIEQHTDVILGTTAPQVAFTFYDSDGNKYSFNRGQLDSVDCLSVGERRAMYLMYVIFECNARIKNNVPTLLILDDIADSFDYKNKYAIIEYLKELSENSLFSLLVLTHNFDFFRTYQSRVLTGSHIRDRSFVANSVEGDVSLRLHGNNTDTNPFGTWRSRCHTNPAMLVSMIPFVRNLIEYKDGTGGDDYLKLTAMLHVKNPDTHQITVDELHTVIQGTVTVNPLGEGIEPDQPILSFIYSVADQITSCDPMDEVSLENKVAVSVAIRLKAEELMWGLLNDKSPINGNNQTWKLLKRLRAERGEENEFKETNESLGRVILMTPENIHLNSFMYEPLMDMSLQSLKRLYVDIKSLADGSTSDQEQEQPQQTAVAPN